MKLFVINQNSAERVARFVISIFLLPSFFIPEPSWYATLVGSVGCILLFNAVVGTCYIYRLFGANTCDIPSKG